MSVAFRRESDEEHKEPRFELPIPPGPNPVTARGLALIEAQVAALSTRAQTEKDAERLEAVRRDLRYWNTRLATAQLAPDSPGDVVAFGARVRFTLNGGTRSVDIVGGDEADPAAGRIAFTAPLARALMGAAVGDLADFNGAPDAIEILEIGPADED
ncbi:MAG: nucleoside-diphosphate kinase [Sphingomonas sp. SCN 67-18]|mgnify:CR=1 FL=1|uniref:GreA/GreB family elongation factor n=1 Tax=uncultured Sphingomonas sp. TaxID=158754 RepID=UPI00086F47A7|nr:GreA/GreB family elongation factor [Sphingomonas sp. SCN 67-18]ODU20527.1 MAG: nucleoside-diphosphate kinase [Sphingomonas sp. SCN 67-18]